MDDPYATPGAPSPASLRAPGADPYEDPYADDPYAEKPSLRKRVGDYLSKQQSQANPAWMRYLDPAYLLDQAGKGAETATDAAVEKIRPISEAADKAVQDMQSPDRGLPSRVAGAVLSSVPSADQSLVPVPRIPQVPGQSYLNPLIYPAIAWNDVAVPLGEMATGRTLATVGAFSPAAVAEAIPGLAGLSAKALRMAAEAKFGSDMAESTWNSIKQAWQALHNPNLSPQETGEAVGKPVTPFMMTAGLVGHVVSETMPPGGATPPPISAKAAAQARIQARAGGPEAGIETAPEAAKVAPAAPVLLDRTIDEFKPGDKFTAGKTEYTVGSSDPDGTVTVTGSDGVEVQLPKGTKMQVNAPKVQETPYSPAVKPTPTVAGGPTTKVEATPAPEGSTSTAGSTLKPEAQVGREKVQDAAAAPPATPPIAEGSRVAVESPSDRAKNAAEPVAGKAAQIQQAVQTEGVDYRYSVQRPQTVEGRTYPGVTQVDVIDPKAERPLVSSNVADLNAAGAGIPDVPDWVPQGQFTRAQIEQFIKEGPPNATGIKSPSPEILRNAQPASPGPQVAGGVPGVDQGAAGARPPGEVTQTVRREPPGAGAEGVKPSILWDSKKGIGNTPNGAAVGHFGFETTMSPTDFLALAAKGGDLETASAAGIETVIRGGKSIAPPILAADWDPVDKVWKVTSHEGRNRSIAIQNIDPAAKMPVQIMPNKGLRARDVTDEMKAAPIIAEGKKTNRFQPPQPKPSIVGEKPAFSQKLFRGTGATPEEVYGPEAVKEGRAVPILGKGGYYAFSEEDAANYGKVSQHQVELKNPLVISSSGQWYDLLDAANAQHLNSRAALFYKEPGKIPEAAERLKAYVQSQGHDGIIVRNTEQQKALRESFGHDTVVSYNEGPPQPKISPKQAAQTRITQRATADKIQTATENGVASTPFEPGKLPDGAAVTRPSETYQKAHEASGGKGNLWVRQSPVQSNAGRTLMVQFASDVLYPPTGEKGEAGEYYDKLYEKRAGVGYKRMADFWEVPQWQAVLSHNLGDKADLYVVRDLEEAKKFLKSSGYDHVAFSVFEPAKAHVLELAPSIDGKIDLGGYPNTSTDEITSKFPNATRFDTVPDYVTSLGHDYMPGYDYRLYKNSEVIPRLELSTGCRHFCKLCVMERVVTEKPASEVAQQVDSFADLHGDLVYLNDKTFGQASNYKDLPKLAEQMRANNPNFKGFVIQTTAAQMKSFTPEFLKASGIKFVEIGVESFNDSVLKLQRKPATEALIQAAADKLKAAGIAMIPNLVIGLPGETSLTYDRTLSWLKANEDNISHANIYNLAVYEGSDLAKEITAKTAADADENVGGKSFRTPEELQADEDFSRDVYAWASGVLDKTPASLQSAKEGAQLELPIEATPEKAVQAVKSPDLPDRPALVAELNRAGHAGEEVVKGLESGDPKALVEEASRGNGSAGRMQSAYFQARKLGLISDTANRAFRTQLLVQNPDLFRLIDGAEKSQGIGIVAVPSVLDPPALLKKLSSAAEIAWTAAREALFNTTGGVSRQVFELFHQMRGRNAAALDTVSSLAYGPGGVSPSFGGKITEEQMTAAAAYLDPRFLNRFSKEGAAAVRAVMAQLTDAQKAALDAGRDFITHGSETMTELGITKEGLSEVIRNNYGRYVSRSYKIFSREQGPAYIRALRTPGTPEYQTRYLPTIKALAADGDIEQSKIFVDRMLDTIAQKNDLPRRVIDNLIRDEVKRLGSNITLNRTLREDSIRNLYGEIVDPIQQLAHTIMKQQELINTWMFRKQLADNLGEQGLVRTIDPDQIARDYADHQKEIVDEEVAKAVKAETMRRADTDQPMTPQLAKAIEATVRDRNPLFSQKVRTRSQELMFEARSNGRTPDFSAATLKAEREVYSEHQEQALEWYRDSGQMEPGESLFALDPAYRAGMQIDSSRNINDPFANLVVTKAARPYLMEYTKMLSKGMNLFQEATQLVNTGATVLAPMTVARNLFTSLQPIISAGNALRLGTSYGREAVVTAQAICNHLIFGAKLDPKLEPLLKECFEQGATARGALSGDTANLITSFRDVYKRTSKLMREVKETGQPSLEPITSRLPGMRPEEAVTKIAWGNESRLSPLLPYEAIARHAQDLYRGGDDFPKIINYLIEKQKASEAYPDDPALALSEAQRKFRATNYDYGRIIPIVRLARQVPIIGLFTSFVSESYRVVANSFGMGLQDMAQGMKTGNAALLRQGSERLIGTSIAVGGLAAYCETSRTAAGLSYEDEKTLRKLLPAWSNNSHLYWYKAADGHVQYINFGKNEMFSAVSQPASALLSRLQHGDVMNDPSATLGKEAWTQVQEVLKPFISPQIFSQALLDVVAGHSATGKPIFAPDDGPGDRAVKSMQYIAAHALNPGVARSAWASIQGAAGATNRFGQPLKAEQPILNLAGLGDIDMKQSFMFYALRGQRDMQAIESEFRTMSQDLSTGVTLDKVYAKLQDVEERRKAYYLDIQRAALVALKTGVSQEDLFTILQQQDFQRRDIGTFLENGKYLPFVPAKSTFLRAEQIGRPLDPDRVLSIVGQYAP